MKNDRETITKTKNEFEEKAKYHGNMAENYGSVVDKLNSILDLLPVDNLSETQLAFEIRHFFLAMQEPVSLLEIKDYLVRINFEFNPKMKPMQSIAISLSRNSNFTLMSEEPRLFGLVEWKDQNEKEGDGENNSDKSQIALPGEPF